LTGLCIAPVLVVAIPLIFLGGIGAAVGMLVLIVAAIYIGCRLLVAVPAGLLEEQGAVDSLKRSWSLTRDNARRAFLILVLYFVLSLAAGFLLAYPFGIAVVLNRNNPSMMLFWTAITQVGTFLAEVLVQPFMTIASAIFYFDLRVRKEGLDIELLMDPQALRAPAPSIVPSMFS